MNFYAAVGSYRIKEENGHKVPYIQKLGKLYPISIPEFVIWSTLLWEVMEYRDLRAIYEEQMRQYEQTVPGFDELLTLLLKRKLVMCGIGYTGADALYNMLADAFVIPYRIRGARKVLKSLKMIAQGKLSGADLFRAFKPTELTFYEQRVSDLVAQTPLNTAEIIRCFDRNVQDVSTPEKVIAAIYTEDDTDQQHIANEECKSAFTNAVLTAVSNLYLKRKVILEIP